MADTLNNSIDIKENYIYQLDKSILDILLKDRTSGKNILWATDMYSFRGEGYLPQDYITAKAITGLFGNVLKPRIKKSQREQRQRVKSKAEVFTPSWVCNCMANSLDSTWFGRNDVFNVEQGQSWTATQGKIIFPADSTWQDYVQLKVLEITCGEAPFLASRYDTVTGQWLSVHERIGLLDRKLRLVSENVDAEPEWVRWAMKAYKSTYGYEWQGDSVLIARENLLFTFIDYYVDKFENFPINEYLIELSKIISWNIWQMDGLKNTIPNYVKPVQQVQMSFFDNEQIDNLQDCNSVDVSADGYCKIKNWQTNRTIKFDNIKATVGNNKGENKMKFDFVIGNPPYQDQGGSGGNNDAPIYQYYLMSGKNIVSKAISLVVPARWFSAGRDNLLGNFRNYMMHTNHLKTMTVYTDSHDMFPNVEIKGGVCYFVIDMMYEGKCLYTYHDGYIKDVRMRNLGEFEVIIRDPFKATIVAKVLEKTKLEKHLDCLISSDTPFGIPSNPRTSEKTLFPVYERNDDKHNTLLYHIENQRRKIEYVSRYDVKKNIEYIDYFKVFIPGAGGSGNDSMVLGRPEFALRNSVCSQSYLFVPFQNEVEAKSFIKYLKTKFLRVLLSALKISQSAPKRCYRYVPIQDFTSNSDIDWSKSIAKIDKQLYKKYGLTADEINFIETHIKEMD